MITRPIRYLVILFVLSGLIFVLDAIHAFSLGFDATNHFLVGPVTKEGRSAIDRGVSVLESIFLFRSFLKESEEIKIERNYFRGEYFRLKAEEEENRFLRDALELDEEPGTSLILVKVIGFDPLLPRQIITIDKGSKAGINKGDPVILSGRILIGIVEDVSPNQSRVLLLTSEDSRIVTRLERSGTTAAISGSASGALILDLVLPETDLVEGEIIVSSGLEGDIPINLLVGQVSKIISEETASFKRAVVRPFFDNADLSQVFVVSK